MLEASPPARSYRVRMDSNQWFVRLYADMTVGDCVGRFGPYANHEAAVADGATLGLPDGDKA